jgi:DNA polymerase-3 subunit delta'
MLARDVAAGRLRHAYLFAGPPGIGKRTLALKFAQALNCEGTLTPCNACRPCTLIAKQAHPDAPLIHSGQAPSARAEAKRGEAERSAAARSLKIEQVRDLERQVALAPYEARYRTPILLRFHEATLAAQNALLKTLEEPPAQVILLLTADSADWLLPTIVSRCQVLALRPLPTALVEQALIERWGIEAARARLLASLSGGRLGWAVKASADDEHLARRSERLGEMLALVNSTRRARLAYAETLSKRGRAEVGEILELWQNWWRDVLLAASEAATALTNVDQTEAIRWLGSQVGPAQALHALESIRSTGEALDRNANVRLALDVMLLDLPQVINNPSPFIHSLIPTSSG